MSFGVKLARMALVWGLATAVTVAGVSVIAAAQADAATQTYTTTANLNVRSGPGTKYSVLATLKKGTTVTGTAAVSNNWLPITYKGKKAYVCASYLKAAAAALKPTATAPATGVTSTTTKKTTVNVNLRAQPSLTATIVKVLLKGTTVQTTGKTSGQFSEVVVSGTNRWVATQYLTAVPTGDALSTTSTDPVAKPIIVAPAPEPQTLYINASNVHVRAQATTASTIIATLNMGAALEATGDSENGFTQVVYKDVVRWVYSIYLSPTKPATVDLGSTSLNKLEPYGKAAVVQVREQFPQIVSIGGWRASSAYSSDHPNGRAIDIMIPNYKSNKALGDKVAAWAIANAKSLHVKYVIWQQRYYGISAGKWTKMADRGSDTQNHMDHVHVSFNAS